MLKVQSLNRLNPQKLQSGNGTVVLSSGSGIKAVTNEEGGGGGGSQVIGPTLKILKVKFAVDDFNRIFNLKCLIVFLSAKCGESWHQSATTKGDVFRTDKSNAANYFTCQLSRN